MPVVITNADIRQMSDEELRRVHSIIVAEIKARHTMQSAQAAQAFRIGDIAEFRDTSRGGHLRQMQINKINVKTIKGREIAKSASPGMTWTVSPGLLTKVPSPVPA